MPCTHSKESSKMRGFNFTSGMINEGVIVNCLYQFLSVPFAVLHWSNELQCTSCISSALVRKRPSEYRNFDQVNRTMVRGLGLSKYRNSDQLNKTTTRCPSENRFAFSSYSSSSLCVVKDPKSLSGWAEHQRTCVTNRDIITVNGRSWICCFDFHLS